MTTSPAGTTIIGQIIDNAGHRWRLQPGVAAVNLQCVRDDVVDTRTANVVRIWLDDQKRLCQENVSGGTWYADDSGNWTQFTAGTTPPPVVTPPPPVVTPPPTTGSGPGPDANGAIKVDFSQPQNYPGRQLQQVVDRRMWGFSTGGAADNSFWAFGDPGFQASAAQLNAPLWRINGNIPQRGDTPFFNDDGSVNGNTFAKLINGFPACDPAGISQVIVGVNIEGVRGFGDAASYGRAMGNLARFLLNATMPNGRKFPILGFESQNEPDNMSVDRIVPYYNAMWAAVKAVSPNLLCCGPVTSWAGNFMPDYQNKVTGLDVYDWHTYQGGYPSVPSPRYSQSKGASDAGALKNVRLDGLRAMFVGEYNIDWNCQDPTQHNAEGATWCGRYLHELLNGCPAPLWGAVWDAWGDGTCGVIMDPSMGIVPTGWMLGQGGKRMFGPRWRVTNAPGGLMVCATTPSPGHCAVWIVNPGGGQQSPSLALARWPVNVSGDGTAEVWQLTNSGRNTTQVPVKAGVLQLNVPDPSVTFVYV